ncbi:MAG: hypothetical protein KBG50_09935, partial [Ruthenibacterium sp.]|nr:hypothetical protein [Ruthenibacterium sp.]
GFESLTVHHIKCKANPTPLRRRVCFLQKTEQRFIKVFPHKEMSLTSAAAGRRLLYRLSAGRPEAVWHKDTK